MVPFANTPNFLSYSSLARTSPVGSSRGRSMDVAKLYALVTLLAEGRCPSRLGAEPVSGRGIG